MNRGSAIYVGDVVHRRYRPKEHRLRYKVFSLLIDLDELPDLDRHLRVFGYNRRALISFWDKDHGSGQPGKLREWVEAQLTDAGLDRADLRIRLLCYPRLFGYVFNPLTVYFCETRDGDLGAILYEVCNTFHERHTYVIPIEGGSQSVVRHSCRKQMYVSPFIPMDCSYQFTTRRPDSRVAIAIRETDGEGSLLSASFSGERRVLSDASLLRTLIGFPLMTLKVTAAIHWEALRLWLKGVPIHRHIKSLNPHARTIVQLEER